MRKFVLIAAGFAAVAGLGGAAYWLREPAPQAIGMLAAPSQPDNLPLPPEMPRLADGADYDRCLSMLRDDPDEALRFAQAWDATGGGEGARHCIALALLGLGEPDRAAERLERLGAASRAGGLARAAVFGQASQAWMMAGDPNRAFAAVTIALTLAPQDVELLVDRSVVLASMQRYRESIEDLDSALAFEPERAEAWVLRAAALRHLERVDQAFVAVERALVLAPDNAEALLERGILRQLRGDAAGARNDWQRAIQLAPDSMAADLAAQNIQLNELGPQRR